MPDPQGETKADEETLPDTSLHAYKEEDRRDQVKGDVDALASGDPDKIVEDGLEGEDELELPHNKH